MVNVFFPEGSFVHLKIYNWDCRKCLKCELLTLLKLYFIDIFKQILILFIILNHVLTTQYILCTVSNFNKKQNVDIVDEYVHSTICIQWNWLISCGIGTNSVQYAFCGKGTFSVELVQSQCNMYSLDQVHYQRGDTKTTAPKTLLYMMGFKE